MNVQHVSAMFLFTARKLYCPLSFFRDNDNVSKKFSDNDILLKHLVISDISKPYLPPLRMGSIPDGSFIFIYLN